MNGGSQPSSVWLDAGCRRLDELQDFRFATAFFLDARRVPEKHLENRQGLLRAGQFFGHVKCGRKRHQSVEADIILAAKSAGVGECASGRELPQLGAGFDFLGEQWPQFGGGRFLHQAHERFESAEVQRLVRLGCKGGASPSSFAMLMLMLSTSAPRLTSVRNSRRVVGVLMEFSGVGNFVRF